MTDILQCCVIGDNDPFNSLKIGYDTHKCCSWLEVQVLYPNKRHAMHPDVSHTELSPSFMVTISYSPALSLPRPLPLPLVSPSPSSAAGGFAAALPPKLMGFNSRHWQAHIPTEVITVALHICSIHQSRFAGSAWEYNEVTMRWTKCIVRAKSSTSFERAMSRRMNTTLSRVSPSLQRHMTSVPNEAVKHPYQPQCPSNCGIAAQASPVE